MYIKRLGLKNFRNFNSISLEPKERLNIFLGANGQGKTSLIEAAYFCSHGSTFRPSESRSVVNDQVKNGRARINAEVISQNKTSEIKIEFSERKSFSVNSKKTLGSGLYKVFPTVLFSPESLSVIKSSQQVRRDFFDEMVMLHQPLRIKLVSEFRRALLSRNRLLKAFTKGLLDKPTFEDLFISLNDSYFRLGSELTLARIEAIAALERDFREATRYIFSNKEMLCSVNYLISGENANTKGLIEIQNKMQDRFMQIKKAEISTGVSLVGPHKHDIQIIFNNKDARYYCSQGQQRTLILTLKISQIMYHHAVYGRYPVLLLDDVMSELDKDKRLKLIEFINNFKSQIFVTTTDLSDLEKISGGQIFELTDGEIKSQC
ncbi:MAG: DNA replication/repair protein RecF [Pseudomonadota bacterium]|nr:DNA replication/repair protein RecF [Pseudomonadota bacterium]